MKTSQLLKRSLLAIILCGLAATAGADWHQGKVTSLGFAYDGTTVVFTIDTVSRSNCVCYPPWPNNMCLNRSRPSFKEEFAWLLKVRTVGQSINVNVDENTCMVLAMYEIGENS